MTDLKEYNSAEHALQYPSHRLRPRRLVRLRLAPGVELAKERLGDAGAHKIAVDLRPAPLRIFIDIN